jgi:DNA-binding transcriptional LysR family regulator
MSFNDLLRQKKFGKQQIEPIYREWVDREVTGLIQTAEKDLSRLFVHSLVINEGSGNIAYGTNNDHFTDAAIAAVATGAGIAVAPTFASMSIVSAGGAFGVFGVTAVSWPIIAVGLVTVGGLIALGGHKATHIKSNAIGKIRNNLKDAIRKQVLGYNSKTESVRERLQIQIETIAAKILLEIDLC